MTLDEMKRLKQEKGYTMEQLSQYSKVPLGTLEDIFAGEILPLHDARQAIEEALRTGPPVEERNPAPEKGHASVTYQHDADSRPTYVQNAAVYDAGRGKRQGEFTVEDYYAWPKEQRIELIDGAIYIMEAPGFVHQQISGRIFSQLDAYIRKNGGSCIPLPSPIDVRLDCDDKTIVQPDLIILCDRDKIRRWGIMGAPDFILEILSPSTRRKDCIRKLQKYCDAGVREYWILDPKKRMLLTYDFVQDCLPRIYPLTGRAGLALYDGQPQIDLDEIAELIRDWPE